LSRLRRMKASTDRLRVLGQGTWPYEPVRANQWQRERLKNLMERLDHDRALPLLLALSENTNEKTFADTCHILEKFFFRYKLICGGHVSKFDSVYFGTAHQLTQSNPIDLPALRRSLQQLLDNEAGDEIFVAKLKELDYADGYGSRLRLKYLLIMIEEYFPSWLQNEEPLRVREDARVLDFDAVTLEHIYPNNAPADQGDPTLEENRGRLGNLTILARVPNQGFGNQGFLDKRQGYAADPSAVTRAVAEHERFGLAEFNARQEGLLELARRIFEFA
jgi:hypothetical protein